MIQEEEEGKYLFISDFILSNSNIPIPLSRRVSSEALV
ncbi:hypothetical protein ADICYQ_2646 [Cyclobacterium qasimii M12-11B]|uniref:Uncharacterized protein n=1 Tax=Cyclobacterium qasimii M12-11B TaxID=641524 RepID=S7WNQ9_9BACT|nr:hypothetical protein ADICYQ_2646 [Cyclobacterium qasimii M12-11B]